MMIRGSKKDLLRELVETTEILDDCLEDLLPGETFFMPDELYETMRMAIKKLELIAMSVDRGELGIDQPIGKNRSK
ncbi:MAG: hypothetical protein EOO38_01670 [Cytophagaceae bacterium]|nr:MAG: hypothetical protein EOO38_01670 [Cytophagaceae bacterium]